MKCKWDQFKENLQKLPKELMEDQQEGRAVSKRTSETKVLYMQSKIKIKLVESGVRVSPYKAST